MSLELKDSIVPGHFVVRKIRPTLSAMGWGAYRIRLAPKCEAKEGIPTGVLVFPIGVGQEVILGALGDTAEPWDLDHYFTGAYMHSAATPGQHVFGHYSVCLRLPTIRPELLEFAQALVSRMGIQAVLVSFANASTFYLVEQSVH